MATGLGLIEDAFLGFLDCSLDRMVLVRGHDDAWAGKFEAMLTRRRSAVTRERGLQ
jgi:hypothetical protein